MSLIYYTTSLHKLTYDGVSCRFLNHEAGFHGRDFIIILVGILQLLLVGMTIFQWFPSAPKGNMSTNKGGGGTRIKMNSITKIHLIDFFEAVGFWYLLVAVLNSGVSLLWVSRGNISGERCVCVRVRCA